MNLMKLTILFMNKLFKANKIFSVTHFFYISNSIFMVKALVLLGLGSSVRGETPQWFLPKLQAKEQICVR